MAGCESVAVDRFLIELEAGIAEWMAACCLNARRRGVGQSRPTGLLMYSAVKPDGAATCAAHAGVTMSSPKMMKCFI
jgi:hypothetical protein